MQRYEYYLIEGGTADEWTDEFPCSSWIDLEAQLLFLRRDLVAGGYESLRISGVRSDGNLCPLMHVTRGRRGSLRVLSAAQEWRRWHTWHYRLLSRLGMMFRLIRYRARRRMGLLREVEE